MPVDWVDGVTWVNAANMEIMEADIAAKQPTSEKGAANGYAPLDASSKVPLVNLPPVSGVDYIGAWGAGTPYKKGDVVRYGGNDYMAVNDSTGVTPPAAFVPPSYAPSYGTTLPSSPVDGQEAILVDSASNPTYQWRFRYNAGSSSAYKWEFVGGAEAQAGMGGAIATNSQYATFVALSGPAITVPRAGDYIASFDLEGQNDQTGNSIMAHVGTVAGTGLLTYAASMVAQKTVVLARKDRVNGVTAGGVIRVWYCAFGGGTATFERVMLHVYPVRVA